MMSYMIRVTTTKGHPGYEKHMNKNPHSAVFGHFLFFFTLLISMLVYILFLSNQNGH